VIRRVVDEYGPHPRQVVEWFLPAAGGSALVMLIHGGYWRPVWSRDIEEATALDLAAHGFAVCSLEYRAYDCCWPATLTDVGTAVDHAVARSADFGLAGGPRAIYGHSAGGGLVAWATSRRGADPAAPGAEADAPTFDAVILHAPVACWARASHDHLGAGAVDILLGGRPDDVPDRYRAADPEGLVPDPLGRRILIHGDADVDVPLSQSEHYLAHLRDAGVDASLITRPGEEHYEILDPASAVAGLRRELLFETLRD
jgi:acetyl esterase/lipase